MNGWIAVPWVGARDRDIGVGGFESVDWVGVGGVEGDDFSVDGQVVTVRSLARPHCSLRDT